MERVNMHARLRGKSGRSYLKEMRSKGLLPAVLYGKKTESVPIVVEIKEFRKALRTAAGSNVIINLTLQGEKGTDVHSVMVRDVEKDPVDGHLLHADLHEISLDDPIYARVPLILAGESKAVKEGGILQQSLRELEVECLPAEIPEEIEVDISGLEIGEPIHVRDLKIPDGIKVLEDGDSVVASVIAPKAAEEAPEAEGAEAKEGRDEEEAEGANEG